MSHRKTWPTEQDKTILQMIPQGMSDAAIARQFGCTPNYISQRVRKMKIRTGVARQDLTIEVLERCMVYRALKLAIERRGILIRQWIPEEDRVCMILLLADCSLAWEVSLEELRSLKDLGAFLDANLVRLTDGQRFVCCKKCAMPLLLSVKWVDEEHQCEKWRGYRAVQAGPQSELITRCPGCRTLLYAGEGKDSFYVERVQEIGE
jgi:DNA-binding CsgD family transcriptional regulator